MLLKTSGGEELSVTMITISDKPMPTVAFRIEDKSVREAIAVFAEEGVLPLQQYEDFTEIESIRRHGRNNVMITLCKPEPENTMPISIPEQVEEE